MYYVYILKCNDGSLYTGIAKDLKARLEIHKLGKGSKYVRAHMPFILVYSEEHNDKSAALKREAAIKKWSRSEKIKNLNLAL